MLPSKPFDLDANHPLCPNPNVIQEHEKVKFPYEESIQDRVYNKWYAVSKGRPVEQEVSQIYRVSKAGRGEYLLWNLNLKGQDWKGNQTDFTILAGKYERPIFRLEKNPETQETSTTQVTSHQTIYTTPYSKQKLDELVEMSVEPVSTIVIAASGKRFGVNSLDDFKNGSIEDLIQVASKGKTLDTVIAERNQFTYEKREQKSNKQEKEKS